MAGKYKRLDGGFGQTPTHWTSNEYWPDEAIKDVASADYDAVVTVGSANICSLAPLIEGLTLLSLMMLSSSICQVGLSAWAGFMFLMFI